MKTNHQVKQRTGGVRSFPAATAVAILFLTVAPAEARWKPAVGVGGIAAGGVVYSLSKHWKGILEKADGMFHAGLNGETREVDRLEEEVDRHMTGTAIDAIPALAGVSRAVEASRSAVERTKKRLISVKRRIGRFLGDPRAALSVGEDERRWYASESGVLGPTPLPAADVSQRSDSRERLATDRWKDSGTASTDWDPQGTNPVGEYALRCGNVYGIGRYSVFYAHWKRLMERHSGECPDDEASDSGWSAVLDEGSGADPWAPDEEEPSGGTKAIPDGSSYDEDGPRHEEGGGTNYVAVLEALERKIRREAERDRQAREEQEARRRAEKLAAAERLRQSERERRRKAEERERRELAASRESQEYSTNTLTQGFQMLNQQSQAGSSGSADSSGSYHDDCPSGQDCASQ